jgi:hypothetical protein
MRPAAFYLSLQLRVAKNRADNADGNGVLISRAGGAM